MSSENFSIRDTLFHISLIVLILSILQYSLVPIISVPPDFESLKTLSKYFVISGSINHNGCVASQVVTPCHSIICCAVFSQFFGLSSRVFPESVVKNFSSLDNLSVVPNSLIEPRYIGRFRVGICIQEKFSVDGACVFHDTHTLSDVSN